MRIENKELAFEREVFNIGVTMLVILSIYVLGYTGYESIGNQILSAIAVCFTVMGIYLYNKRIASSFICFTMTEVCYTILTSLNDRSINICIIWMGLIVAAIRIYNSEKKKETVKISNVGTGNHEFTVMGILDSPTSGISVAVFYILMIVSMLVVSTYLMAVTSAQELTMQLINMVAVFAPTMLLLTMAMNLKMAQYIRLMLYGITAAMQLVLALSIDSNTMMVGCLEFTALFMFTWYVIAQDENAESLEYKSEQQVCLEELSK